MRAKSFIILLIASIAVSLWLLIPRPPADAVGLRVFIIRPVATARYLNNGKPARDDELLYGFAGAVTGPAIPGGGYPVRMDYGYTVHALTNDVIFADQAPQAWRRPPDHIVVGAFADILTEPDIKAYPPRFTLTRGSPLWSEGVEGDYRKVILHDNTRGYIRAVATRPVRSWNEGTETARRDAVIADALLYRGAPYRWGGKTPAGIDCSGLASMAYLLNGLSIHRNSTPSPGYPVALLHIPAAPGGYDRHSLARAKKGDLIYWQGHQALYLGDGRYVHANATTADVAVHSLIRGDPDFLPDPAKPDAILTWATAFPAEPEKLTVRRFIATQSDPARRYRFYARLDGYAPTRAVLYPEGMGEGKPAIAIDNPGEMIYGPLGGDGNNVPSHTYAVPGTYYPAIIFTNDTGWLPNNSPIDTGIVRMSTPVNVK